MTADDDAARLRGLALGHPIIRTLLDRWTAIDLPDAWLSGSLIAQARWNERFGLPCDHGISDADIIYCDPSDLSPESEASHGARLASLFADLPVPLDVRNQARVHIWYPGSFGFEIEPYRSSREAIATFPTTSAAVGLRLDGGMETAAPFGLGDLLRPVVRANATQITPQIFAAKAARWRSMWPDLEILPWSAAVSMRQPAG
ncbi:nucleotidyltransferase family protein [Sphingobium nicotianae]|uniref:Nucleotidyltransferase family protein n=1 Tax=Sphingobium nicotianae TaxID=2782607 RepID=A0A9X1AJM9_9SPHN|nr:nucleotidyltransferase family protein [Sphingobium nicotianae]MBT2185728.1 nucleotidyltransferase family protein [Sphingobium nicotianae]